MNAGRVQRLASALMPLRLFLGGTFVYAGIQKLSDPGFLHPGAATYIGTQLHGFANGTPGGFILRTFAIPIPEVAGVGVAVTEILVGLLVLFGLYTRLAAAVGMGLNLLLFLTASWHTTPYFLGPDLVFTFAWTPFVIAGAEGQPSLDTMLDAHRRRSRRDLREGRHSELEPFPGAFSRRALLLELGGAAAAIAGVSMLAKGSYTAARSLGARGSGSGARGSGGHSSGAKETSSGGGGGRGGGEGGGGNQGGAGSGSQVPADAVELGSGTQLPAGAGATYADPVSGEPDILIRSTDGSLTAFSAVCTHAGCTVGYENGVIICPCHGGEYSPETGAVIAGPPPAGLEPKKVLESGGKLYAVPS